MIYPKSIETLIEYFQKLIKQNEIQKRILNKRNVIVLYKSVKSFVSFSYDRGFIILINFVYIIYKS